MYSNGDITDKSGNIVGAETSVSAKNKTENVGAETSVSAKNETENVGADTSVATKNKTENVGAETSVATKNKTENVGAETSVSAKNKTENVGAETSVATKNKTENITTDKMPTETKTLDVIPAENKIATTTDNSPAKHNPNEMNDVLRDENGNFIYSNGNIMDKKGNLIDKKGNIIAKNFDIKNKNGNISDENGNFLYSNGDITDKSGNIIRSNSINTTEVAKNTNEVAKNTNEVAKNTNEVAKNTNEVAKNTTVNNNTRVSGTNYNNKVRNTISADGCAKATLYDVSNGVAKLVKEIPCANENNTDFALAPNKKYIFALEKAGETLQMREVSTLGSRRSEMFRPKLDGREVSAELPKADAAVATNTSTPAPQQGEKFTMKGSLAANDGSVNNLAGAQVVLYKMQNETQVTEIARQPLAADNSYSFEVEHGNPYKIVAEKPGYLTVSQEFTANKTAPILANNEKMVLREKKNNVAYNVKDINYEFGSYALAPEGMQNLDGMIAMLRDNATIIVEISAHTDNIGAPATNLVLSQKRAQSVVDYLVGKGVDKTRLKAQGYGETKPIAANTNEAGRTKNRRTEFKLVGEVK